MIKTLKNKRGEGYIDVCVYILAALLILALIMNVLSVFIAKQQLNTFATELMREAEIAGRIGIETSRREQVLREKTGLDPTVNWSKSGKVNLGSEITLTLTLTKDIGLFGGFSSFPITLRSEAMGKSEVYYK